MDLTPVLSVLVPGIKGIASVKAAIRAWTALEHQDLIEVLIASPDTPEAAGLELPANCLHVPTGGADLHDARAMALRAARGEYVVLAEDHCLPDPDWSGPVLERLREGWDGIGPALRPGTRGSIWPEGCFLIGYGEWMEPIGAGQVAVLCGWNSTLRRSKLLELPGDLGEYFQLGAFAIKELRERNCRFYLEPRARMRHFDVPGFGFCVSLLYLVGKGFGAKRTQHWNPVLRILYPLAMPLIALMHFRRAVLGYQRAGRDCRVGIHSLLVGSMVFALAWAVGEGVGAWIGMGRVVPHLWRTEVKPVSEDAEARSREWEQRTGFRNWLC